MRAIAPIAGKHRERGGVAAGSPPLIGRSPRIPDGRAHPCPLWISYTFDNPLRRLFHRPARLFGGLVKEGDVVVDLGCGRGYFSIALAGLAGPTGRVIAVDLQPAMLERVCARARKKGFGDRVRPHLARPESIGLEEQADFVLAFWMIHEVPDRLKFLAEARALLKPSGLFFAAEPKLHVAEDDFGKTLKLAQDAGFELRGRPAAALSRAALFGPAPPGAQAAGDEGPASSRA